MQQNKVKGGFPGESDTGAASASSCGLGHIQDPGHPKGQPGPKGREYVTAPYEIPSKAVANAPSRGPLPDSQRLKEATSKSGANASGLSGNLNAGQSGSQGLAPQGPAPQVPSRKGAVAIRQESQQQYKREPLIRQCFSFLDKPVEADIAKVLNFVKELSDDKAVWHQVMQFEGIRHNAKAMEFAQARFVECGGRLEPQAKVAHVHAPVPDAQPGRYFRPGPVITFKVIMKLDHYNLILSETLKYPNLETGGDLFGQWSEDGTARILFAIGPGVHAQRTVHSFRQDLGYLRTCGENLHPKGAFRSLQILSGYPSL